MGYARYLMLYRNGPDCKPSCGFFDTDSRVRQGFGQIPVIRGVPSLSASVPGSEGLRCYVPAKTPAQNGCPHRLTAVL